tara:strand:+ start:161 stop:319 length:159 start_codon:yes stop_codon:yes gene_type:complete
MKISEIVSNLESCIIAFEEGASDEKRMAISVLEEIKEKLESTRLFYNRKESL